MTVEEAKFYPTPDREPQLPLDPGELPASYGKNRVVLLPVEPYLLYAYWELAPDAPPTAGARPVLRFQETPGRPFDVEIDLAAGNWYVHLWSAGKTYQAELGLRGEDGTFMVLAQSNIVSTPPAAPVPPSGEPIEPVEAEPAPTAEPGPVVETNPPGDAIETTAAVVPVDPQIVEPDAATKFAAKLAELSRVDQTMPPLPEPYLGTDFTASQIEVALEQEAGSGFEESPAAEAIPFNLGSIEEMDLTQYSEERFIPGISSQGGTLGE